MIEAQKGFLRVRIDVSRNSRVPLRTAIGAPASGAPFIAFFDASGALVADAALKGWNRSRNAERVVAALDLARTR